MKIIKALVLNSLFLLALPTWSQGLGPDFVCSGKISDDQSFEVVINNYDFAKEVTFKFNSKMCNFPITSGSYTEKGAASVMILNFELRETCPVRKVTFLEKGFLKVQLHKKADEAYILAMTGQPVKCDVKTFNKRKLSSRIQGQ